MVKKHNISAERWLKIFFLTSLLVAGVIGSFNYLVDPYGLNHLVKVKKFNFYKHSNTGYAFRFKSNIFKNKKFNALMIGTSRIGVMNPEVVDGMLNSRTFNFASSGSITEIQRDLFFYALKNNQIENVIYGVDFLSLNGTIKLEEKFKEFCNVQETLKKNNEIYNYDLYFNFDTLVESYDVVVENFLGKAKDEKKYNFQNGMRDYVDYISELEEGKYNYDSQIAYSIKSYYASERTGGYQKYQFSKKYLMYIKEIVDYCQLHNIKLWVYIPPMYKDHFDALSPYGLYDEFEYFKRELLNIVNYVDFTGHNSITDNKVNFWDGSHLKKELTSLIMGRLLKVNDTHIPNDFGIFVTKDNLDMHLKKMRQSIQFYDLNKTLNSSD